MPEVDLILGNEEKLEAKSYQTRAFGIEDEEKVLNTQAVEQTRDEDNVGNQPVSSPLRESQFMSQVNLNQNQQPPPEPN